MRVSFSSGIVALSLCALSLAGSVAYAQTTLGAFTFNNSQFGDTLVEADGGTFSATNWINIVNANPGNPAYLTGVNFDTGIANITNTVYTIGYNTPIVNGAGADLGLVAARFSSDSFQIAVSQDGVNFTSFQTISIASGVDTGVGRTYFYNTAGPFPSTLFVSPIDLDLFGIPASGSIQAVRVTTPDDGDLIRVAGFGTVIVPEPSTLALVATSASAGLAFLRRKRA